MNQSTKLKNHALLAYFSALAHHPFSASYRKLYDVAFNKLPSKVKLTCFNAVDERPAVWFTQNRGDSYAICDSVLRKYMCTVITGGSIRVLSSISFHDHNISSTHGEPAIASMPSYFRAIFFLAWYVNLLISTLRKLRSTPKSMLVIIF